MQSAIEIKSGQSFFNVQYYTGYKKVIVFTNTKSNTNHIIVAEITYQTKSTKESFDTMKLKMKVLHYYYLIYLLYCKFLICF